VLETSNRRAVWLRCINMTRSTAGQSSNLGTVILIYWQPSLWQHLQELFETCSKQLLRRQLLKRRRSHEVLSLQHQEREECFGLPLCC
ncbi:hypothetical protein NPIL_204621, partial [Nephila pilipes]